MDLTRILYFAGAHFLCAAAIATSTALVRRANIAAALALLAGVTGVTLLASQTTQSFALLDAMATDLQAKSGTALVAIGLGISTALPWLLLTVREQPLDSWSSRIVALLLIGSPLGSMACLGALAYRDRQPPAPLMRAIDERFVVEEIANFSQGVFGGEAGAYPICVAIDEQDRVYVSLQLKGQEDYSGQILEIVDSPEGVAQLKTIADSPALFRVYGLAVRGGEIFVSRSGFLPRAKDGRIEYENSGAITRLRDLDRDGMMDFYEDVITDLPGSQGPIPQHANAAIAFDTDGNLFITQGVHSDRETTRHPWEGKILKASADFSEVTVFASGIRHPFGLAFGPRGKLFATDNDVTIGNPGDELNAIEQGAHYGHPFVVGNDDGGGQFKKPIYLSASSSYAGLAFRDEAKLPSEYRNSLFVADFAGNQILSAALAASDEITIREVVPLAKVPSPIGVAVTSQGVLYVTSYNGCVYRITQRDAGVSPRRDPGDANEVRE